MVPPWVLVFIGLLASAFGGFLTFMGIDANSSTEAVIGWGIGGLGGLVLFVGLIAIAVQIGVEAADR